MKNARWMTYLFVALMVGGLGLLPGTSGLVQAGSGQTSSITDWEWSHYWPFDPPLYNHLWLDLGGGEELFFLHFADDLREVDDPFDPAYLNENLMYIGLGQRGRFFAEEHPGAQWTHFHQLFADSVAEGHGGPPGANGFWLVHVATHGHEMPWGEVSPGVDFNFMPTAAPGQGEAPLSASVTDWTWDMNWPFTPPLTNHVWLDVGEGRILFMHYDGEAMAEGSQLMYVGEGIRGRFCAEDRPDEAGYSHFHQFQADSVAEGHGGDPGAEGYWLRHISVRDMEMPWGQVSPGVDFNFMPTPAPSCSQ